MILRDGYIAYNAYTKSNSITFMATVEQDTNHKTFLIQYNEKDRSMWMWQWDDINGNGFLDPEDTYYSSPTEIPNRYNVRYIDKNKNGK